MKQEGKVTIVQAEIIEKKCQDYFPIPGKIPTPENLCEVTLRDEAGNIRTFEISSFESAVIEVGDQGTLKYAGNKLIAFGEFIKEFTM